MDPEVQANRAPVARENEGDPAPQERQDVHMSVEALVESASSKRVSDAVALVCDSELRAKDARNMTCKTYWNPKPRRGPGA